MLPEIRMARIIEAIGQYRTGRLSCVEAAEVLGVSERHFRRGKGVIVLYWSLRRASSWLVSPVPAEAEKYNDPCAGIAGEE